jgi:transcriptional regulator
LVESLNSKINTNPNSSEIEKAAISDFEKAYSTIKEYLDACIEAKDEIYALIEKATVPYVYDAVDPEDENELEVPAPVKYDIDELVQAIEEHTKENSEPEENTNGIEFTEEDADDKTDTEDVDDKEFPI